jgi:predicted permease
MLSVMGGILPPITLLMTLMALGLLLGRLKILGKDFNKGLNFLLLKITFPCLIVVSMQKPFTPQLAVLGGWAFLVSFLLYLVLFLVSLLIFHWTKIHPSKKGIYRFVIMFSNVAFMGFPLIEALWGRDAIFLGALFNISFNLFVFSVGIWVLTRHRQQDGFPFREILVNPGLWATLLGFLFFLCSFALPPLLYKTVDTLGSLTTPLAMILVGSLLSQTSLRSVWKGWGIWIIAVLRLILIPVAVWAVLLPCRLPTEITRLAILVVAMPAASNASMMAVEYTDHPELAGQVVFMTTALSFVTIPVLVVLLGLG